MQRSSEQEQALQQTIDQLHDPKSPNFHKWLTPAQFGQSYGAAQQDIDTVTAWLRTHGFVVNSVYPNGLVIDFSGTAAQVRGAFHTEIHYLDVNGQRHVANMSDPQIPAALAPAVSGVASMHDFSPRPMRKAHANYTFTSQGSTYQAMTPADLATIYDFNPLFQAGITGQGSNHRRDRGCQPVLYFRLGHVPLRLRPLAIHLRLADHGEPGAGQRRQQLRATGPGLRATTAKPFWMRSGPAPRRPAPPSR